MFTRFNQSAYTDVTFVLEKKKLKSHEIEVVIDIWKNTKNRVIFSIDL